METSVYFSDTKLGQQWPVGGKARLFYRSVKNAGGQLFYINKYCFVITKNVDKEMRWTYNQKQKET